MPSGLNDEAGDIVMESLNLLIHFYKFAEHPLCNPALCWAVLGTLQELRQVQASPSWGSQSSGGHCQGRAKVDRIGRVHGPGGVQSGHLTWSGSPERLPGEEDSKAAA